MFALFYSDDIYCFVAEPVKGFTICCSHRDAVNEQLVLLSFRVEGGGRKSGPVKAIIVSSQHLIEGIERDNIASSEVC